MIGSRYCHFEIERLLGTGGMGEVYLAVDMNLERRVALKFLPRSLTTDRTAQGRLLDEARSCARLQHPNIAVIHSVEEDGGVYAICMEYVEGANLREILANRRLDIRRIVEVALGTARGIAAAHDHGIIHRDIKPANVVITGKGRVKVMDFGLALRPRRTVETTGPESYGTVAYMSPEQARGQELSPASDIFSFGSLLYQMVTGSLPFKGENDLATLHAIISEEPQPLRELRRDVPPGLERLITSCLQKDPSRRPTSMDEAVEVLQRQAGSVKRGPHDLITELTMGLETESLRRRHSGCIRPISKPFHASGKATVSKSVSKSPAPSSELDLRQMKKMSTGLHRVSRAHSEGQAERVATSKPRSPETAPPLWKDRLSTRKKPAPGSKARPAPAVDPEAPHPNFKPWWKTTLIGLFALVLAAAAVLLLQHFVIQAPPRKLPTTGSSPTQVQTSMTPRRPVPRNIENRGFQLNDPVEPLPDMIELQLPPAG